MAKSNLNLNENTIDYAQMAAEMETEGQPIEEIQDISQWKPGTRQKFAINFAEDSGFDPLPKGQVLCKAQSAELKMSKNNQPYIAITYAVIEDGQYYNRRLWNNVSLAPKAMWRSKKVFEAHGFNVDELDGLETNEANMVTSPDFTANEVVLEINQEPTQDGKGVRNAIIEVYPGDFTITDPIQGEISW